MESRINKLHLLFILLIIFSINLFTLASNISGLFHLNDYNYLLVKYILVILFYLLVVYILWFENDSLEIFHFDRLTLWLVALSGSIFHKKLGIPNEFFFQIILGILSIAIFIALFKYRSKIPRTKAKWAIFGLVVGILISLIIIRIEFLIQQLVDIEVFSPQNYRILEIASKMAYQLSYIAPLEEVL